MHGVLIDKWRYKTCEGILLCCTPLLLWRWNWIAVIIPFKLCGGTKHKDQPDYALVALECIAGSVNSAPWVAITLLLHWTLHFTLVTKPHQCSSEKKLCLAFARSGIQRMQSRFPILIKFEDFQKQFTFYTCVIYFAFLAKTKFRQ